MHNAKIGLLKGCFTGLRHSDWAKLQIDDSELINNKEYYRVYVQKTREHIYILANDRLKAILEHPTVERSLNKTNKNLKKMAQEAGIDDLFTYPVHKGSETTLMTVPKFEKVTTHIGRRSFAVNSLLGGVDHYLIMKAGGWKSESSFKRYLQLSSVDGLDVFSDIY
jgi:site-specific recombinase XerD